VPIDPSGESGDDFGEVAGHGVGSNTVRRSAERYTRAVTEPGLRS